MLFRSLIFHLLFSIQILILKFFVLTLLNLLKEFDVYQARAPVATGGEGLGNGTRGGCAGRGGARHGGVGGHGRLVPRSCSRGREMSMRIYSSLNDWKSMVAGVLVIRKPDGAFSKISACEIF